MVSVNEQDKRNECAENGEVDHDVSIDWKSFVIDGKGVEEFFPSTGDREEVHYSQSDVTEVPEYPHRDTNAECDLQSARGVDLKQTQIDLVKMARKPLILTGRNQLMRCP